MILGKLVLIRAGKLKSFLGLICKISNTAGDVELKGLQPALQLIQCMSEPEKRSKEKVAQQSIKHQWSSAQPLTWRVGLVDQGAGQLERCLRVLQEGGEGLCCR